MGGQPTKGKGVDGPHSPAWFCHKLSSLVVSATRTVLAPAVPTTPGPGDDSEVIMIPLLVFHGGDRGRSGTEDEASQTSDIHSALDSVVKVAEVSRALNSMSLPHQKVVVVGAVHALSEHPQVSICDFSGFPRR